MMAYGLYQFMKMSPPLIMQALLQPITLWDSPAFQVHLRGKRDDEAPYERPWPSNNPLGQWVKAKDEWEAAQKRLDARRQKALNGMKRAKPKETAKSK
jgi:hypothetical protein